MQISVWTKLWKKKKNRFGFEDMALVVFPFISIYSDFLGARIVQPLQVVHVKVLDEDTWVVASVAARLTAAEKEGYTFPMRCRSL